MSTFLMLITKVYFTSISKINEGDFSIFSVICNHLSGYIDVEVKFSVTPQKVYLFNSLS